MADPDCLISETRRIVDLTGLMNSEFALQAVPLTWRCVPSFPTLPLQMARLLRASHGMCDATSETMRRRKSHGGVLKSLSGPSMNEKSAPEKSGLAVGAV